MKAILISIKPKWVAKILNGEKTIEIRKTMPKCDLPIDVYIYCTKDNNGLVWGNNGKGLVNAKLFPYSKGSPEHNRLVNGKVVAKFTLNKVEEIIPGFREYDDPYPFYITKTIRNMWDLLGASCLEFDELKNYLQGNKEPEYVEDEKGGYAWYISNLVIFDKPKELSEFWVNRDSYGKVNNKAKETYKDTLTKAPQSYCFIEVGE